MSTRRTLAVTGLGNTTPRCREDSLLSFGRNGTRFIAAVTGTQYQKKVTLSEKKNGDHAFKKFF